MGPSLTDTLCIRCGLCCDGSLFAGVEPAGRAEALARHPDPDPRVNRGRAGPEAAMSEVEVSLRKAFLDGGGRRHAPGDRE